MISKQISTLLQDEIWYQQSIFQFKLVLNFISIFYTRGTETISHDDDKSWLGKKETRYAISFNCNMISSSTCRIMLSKLQCHQLNQCPAKIFIFNYMEQTNIVSCIHIIYKQCVK